MKDYDGERKKEGKLKGSDFIIYLFIYTCTLHGNSFTFAGGEIKANREEN